MKHLLRHTIIVCLTFLIGCLDRFETPVEFEKKEYICDEMTTVFAESIENCRSRPEDPCLGIIGMIGTLQGTPIRFTSEIVESTFRLIKQDDTEILNRIDVVGLTPYFFISMELESIGGEVSSTPQKVNRILVVERGVVDIVNEYINEQVEMSMRISNGSNSVTLGGDNQSGALFIMSQARNELKGFFYATFGDPGNRVEGCFHFFSRDVRTVFY